MKNTLFGFQPITSISFSNDEIIENIMLLYDIDRFDLDCTYSIGHFWKKLPQPKNKKVDFFHVYTKELKLLFLYLFIF